MKHLIIFLIIIVGVIIIKCFNMNTINLIEERLTNVSNIMLGNFNAI